MGRHVVISYSHADYDYVRRLGLHLENIKFDVWTDERIQSGALYAMEIEDRIRTCAVLIAVISPDANKSSWVANEIEIARKWNRPIMPLLLSGDAYVGLLHLHHERVIGGRIPRQAFFTRIRKFVNETREPSVRVIVWGDDRSDAVRVPSDLTDVDLVAAGNRHCLARHSDGRVTGWGVDLTHKLALEQLTEVMAVAAGFDYSLILHTDGRVRAVGNAGQRFAAPDDLTGVTAIAAGGRHGLALLADRRVRAWGDDACRQATVPDGLRDVIAIAAGARHSLALDEQGRVWSWGYLAGPERAAQLENVSAIAAGGSQSVALHNDRHITAWGGPQVPDDLDDVSSIAAGFGHVLALRLDGSVSTWGSPIHRPPTDLEHVVDISAGARHSMAIVLTP
jgi:hypothetical protein